MRKPLLSGSFPRVLLALCFLCPSLAHAVIPNRIAQAVSDTQRASMSGGVSPRAKAATDQGVLASNRQLTDLSIHFSMTAAQQASLDQLLLDQQNPSSPLYHQWLTPEQFGAQFGTSTADIAKITAWLTSHGLAVTGVSRSSNYLTFNGSAGQVSSAFGTTLHSLTVNGETHFANLTEPTIPAAFASLVGSITGLHDFHPRPRIHSRFVDASTVKPQYTSGATGSHFIAPGDFYTIYNVSPLLTASTPTNGSGITIAVMGQTDISLADVAAFRAASGLSVNPPTVKLVPMSADPGTSSNDLDEASLDVEWSGAVAPSASILYVNSTDVLGISLPYAVSNNVAPIITISYGNCEAAYVTTSGNAMAPFQQIFQQANAQGQTVISAAGDEGATDCEENFSTSPTVAANGLAVDFPASSPNVTGLGGTMFNEGSASASYWNTSNGANSGSAKSYIPEAAWNETATDGASSTGAVIPGSLAGGGGGASSYFTKPSWQTGTGVPADVSRDVPDISLNAAFVHDGYLMCSSNSCVNGYVGTPVPNANCPTGSCLNVVGGTSVAAPSFAGMLALVLQKNGLAKGVGNANPTIYALANSAFNSAVFHDVTTGNNAMPCTLGTTNCSASNPNYNASTGMLGYSATTGYDLATGWGTINALNLATDWSMVTVPVSTLGTTVSTVTISASPGTTVSAGTSITFTVRAASGLSTVTTTPTGTVQFLVDGVVTGTAAALSSGSATYTLSTTSLSAGAHVVTAAYTGDTVFAGSKGTVSLDITSASSADFSFTPATSTITVKSGAAATGVVYTVTPLNGFTGTVTFSASTTSSSLAATYAFVPTTVAITGTTAATTTFTLYAYQSSAKTTVGQSKLGTAVGSNTPGPMAPARFKWLAGSGLTVAAMLLFTLPRRRRWSGLLVALLSVGLFVTAGCGGSSSTAASTGTTTSTVTNSSVGSYSVQVTASATIAGATVTHTENVTFVVQ